VSEDDEYDLLWSGAILDIEKIVSMMKNCDKECRSCTKVEKDDCFLELRESVHSLAMIVKNAILSMVETAKDAKENPLPEKPVEPLYT